MQAVFVYFLIGVKTNFAASKEIKSHFDTKAGGTAVLCTKVFLFDPLRSVPVSPNWIMDMSQILNSVVKLTGIRNEDNIAANVSLNPR